MRKIFSAMTVAIEKINEGKRNKSMNDELWRENKSFKESERIRKKSL